MRMVDEKNIHEQYNLWLEKVEDPTLLAELEAMTDDNEAIRNAFYKDLGFGTAGIRGEIAAGTNRMNIYTVARAAQGQSNHINKTNSGDKSVAIAYDSRVNSELFSKVTAAIFAANGIKVYIYPELSAVPTLSFAIRELKTDAGVVLTASHNPAKYNGYKAYGPDGCQISTEESRAISDEMNSLDIFEDIVDYDFDQSLTDGQIEYIKPEVMDKYIESVKSLSLLSDSEVDKDIKIIYSPLNGTGLKPVLRILNELGYTNISVVKEQEHPDGNFPTCPYPNPEIPEAMALGVEYAKREDADIFMATDPDADRVGIAIKDSNDEFQLLSGNLVGVLLLEYICHRLTVMERMPEQPVLIKTTETTSLSRKIATTYGVETIDVLTGFKYIGEKVNELEAAGRLDDFLLGYEESYGYLTGSHVRDKDAINGAFLIAEMFTYYKSQGISLFDKLQDIYDTYGFTLDTQHAYRFEGQAGFEKMKQIMQDLRQPITELAGLEVTEILDYNLGVRNLPKSEVIQFVLGDHGQVIVRPSGTEPLIRVYISLITEREQAQTLELKLKEAVEQFGKIV